MSVSPESDPGAVRRLPEQSRSRERVERVLAAAAELIARVGIDAMTMSELAESADVSLPSIYRYFPSKQTIVQTLFHRYAEQVREELTEAVGDVTAADGAHAAVARAMYRYWELYRDDATLAAVWSAVVADPDLAALDVADSRQNGRLLAEAFREAVPDADAARLEELAFLASHLAGATVRLGVMVDDDEAERLVADFVDRVLPPLLGLRR